MSNYQGQTQVNLSTIDRQLDALVDITGQQKVIAGQMNAELVDQTQMIGNTNQKMDEANNKVEKATEKVVKAGRSSSSCISWVLIIIEIAVILFLVL